MLQELVRLVRDLAERVRALEQRSPSWDPWPADIRERLDRLERFLQEQEQIRNRLARIDALEARRDPVSLRPTNAQRMVHGAALRAAIADILQSDPAATGPRQWQCTSGRGGVSYANS